MKSYIRFIVVLFFFLLGGLFTVTSSFAQTPSSVGKFECLGNTSCGEISNTKPAAEPIAGCGKPGDVGNEKGVGKYCTKGGGECSGQEANICPADIPFLDPNTPKLCSRQCSTNADCGSGAVCFQDTLGKGCKPIACDALTNPSPSVTPSIISPTVSVTPSPSGDPCETNPASQTAHKIHHAGYGNSTGLIVKIIELFIKFIEALINFFGGGGGVTPPGNTPSPAPSGAVPSGSVTPSGEQSNPCLSPSPSAEPSINEEPSPSIAAVVSPSVSPEVSSSVSPEPSVSGAPSLSPEPSVSIAISGEPSISTSPSMEVSGEPSATPSISVTPVPPSENPEDGDQFKGLIERFIAFLEKLIEHLTNLLNGNQAGSLRNSSFEDGTAGWQFNQRSSAKGSFNVTTEVQEDGTNVAQIIVDTPAENPWDVEVAQYNLPITSGKTYEVSFSAKAANNRAIDTVIQQSVHPFAQYDRRSFELTTEWQNFTYTFQAPVTQANVFIGFQAGLQTGTVWIDNISFRETQ